MQILGARVPYRVLMLDAGTDRATQATAKAASDAEKPFSDAIRQNESQSDAIAGGTDIFR